MHAKASGPASSEKWFSTLREFGDFVGEDAGRDRLSARPAGRPQRRETPSPYSPKHQSFIKVNSQMAQHIPHSQSNALGSRHPTASPACLENDAQSVGCRSSTSQLLAIILDGRTISIFQGAVCAEHMLQFWFWCLGRAPLSSFTGGILYLCQDLAREPCESPQTSVESASKKTQVSNLLTDSERQFPPVLSEQHVSNGLDVDRLQKKHYS